ncbi:MAG: hypothetical protein AAB438_01770 [Patescibacteria group bacterium]|mgnify:CR=1 FL=1
MLISRKKTKDFLKQSLAGIFVVILVLMFASNVANKIAFAQGGGNSANGEQDALGGENDIVPDPPNPNVTDPGGAANPQTLSPDGGNTSSKYSLLAPLPGLENFDADAEGEGCALSKYFNVMIKILIGLSAVFAMIMIIIGGIEYMTTDAMSKKEEGKERALNAVFGLILALASYAILNTINPKLLDLCPDIPSVAIGIYSEGNNTRLATTQTSDTAFKRTSYYDTINSISAQYGIPPCLLQVAIQRESGGNPGLVGHDENVSNEGIRSRRDFIASGVRYKGSTFTPGDRNSPQINDNSIKNDDMGATSTSASNPNASDLGLDWRFSHSMGLFGVTFGPNHLNPAGAKEILNNPSKDIQKAAQMMKAAYAACGHDVEKTWRMYGSGKCNGDNAFTNVEAPLRKNLYDQCVAQS